MGTKNYNNYSDMITFSRASSGTALAKISGGGNLLSGDSSTFTTGFGDWAYYTGGTATVTNGAFTYSASGATTYQIGSFLTVGKAYKITYDFTRTVDTFGLMVGDRLGAGTQVRTPLGNGQLSGTITGYIICGFSAASIGVYANAGGSGTIDNVIIEEVLYDQPNGTLQLFNHPANTPRVEYDYQGNRLGLLVEEARTNNVTNSEACEFVAQVSGTVTTSTTPAPFGLSSVVKRVQASALDSGARLSVSVLVGGDNHSSVYVRSRTGADQNLKITSSGTVGATQVAPASGDWVRLGVTASLGAGSRDVRVLSVGDAIDLDIALPQTELGTFPTSYIPTSGATATRSADVAEMEFNSLPLSKRAHTWVAEWSSDTGYGEYFAVFAINSQGVSGFTAITNVPTMPLSTSNIRNYARDDGFGINNGTLGAPIRITDTSVHSGAISIASGDQQGVLDGTLGAGATSVHQWIYNGNLRLHDVGRKHLKSIAYYPRRLTDAQIKALTSPPETPTLSLTFDDSSTSYLETSIHG